MNWSQYALQNNPYIPYNEIVNRYTWDILGYSSEERPILSMKLGNGTKSVCLWAGMHGNETTGIHILFRLIELFQLNQLNLAEYSLHIIPVINPDAYVRYSRRNGLGIDLNRDFRSFQTIESAKLIGWIKMIEPELCFNLHDQRTIFHLNGTSAYTSLLVPSQNEAREVTELRQNVMYRLGNALTQMNQSMVGIGRYTDEFYPTAVGDYLMSEGIPNILIESGVAKTDWNRNKAREFGVKLILASLTADFRANHTYETLPLNQTGQLETVFTDVNYAFMSIDVAVKAIHAVNGHTIETIYVIDEIGDLEAKPRLQEISSSDVTIVDVLTLDRPITGDFGTVVFEEGRIIAGSL